MSACKSGTWVLCNLALICIALICIALIPLVCILLIPLVLLLPQRACNCKRSRGSALSRMRLLLWSLARCQATSQ